MAKKCLLISPHLDDAILGAGSFISSRPDCDVLSVFSGIPMHNPDEDGKPYVTEYDLKCGFNTSKDAMVVRRQEDEEACALLNATRIHTDLLDSQYTSDDQEVEAVLKDFLQGGDYEMIVGPLGLRHPDHIEVSNALLALDLPNLYLYEDLPARVTHPEEVCFRKEEIGLSHYLPPVFIGDGQIADKIRALWCYKSQMNTGDLDPYLLYVPERFWRVK